MGAVSCELKVLDQIVKYLTKISIINISNINNIININNITYIIYCYILLHTLLLLYIIK